MSRTDRTIGAVLLVAAFALGTWYVPQVVRAGGRPHFYQDHFAAAVMLACGHGYVNVRDDAVAGLREFLTLQRDELACDDRLAAAERIPHNPLQRAYRYLMTTVAWTWKVQGRVAWSALAPLYGLLFGAAILLLFAVFRQGMGPWLAAAIAATIAVSPLHIAYLAQLRDYSKMPFVLAIVLLSIRLVLRPMPFTRALKLAAIAGLVTGIGMGFRNDLLIAVPALVAVTVLFTPRDQFRTVWHGLVVPAVFLATFAIALSPMWSIYRIGGGNSSQHLWVLGLSEPFREELGLDDGGMYEWTYDYRDELTHALISAHAARALDAGRMLPLYGPEYDRAGGDYMRRIIATFPADMAVRVFASTLRVLELPYNQKLIPPHHQFLQLPRSVFVIRDRFQRALAPAWLAIVGLALVILTFHEVRIGLFALAMVCYLGAYPSIQFGERHYFHLEFISWWALGFVASLAGRSAMAAYRGGARTWLEQTLPADARTRVVRVVSLALVVGLAVAGSMAYLRSRQQQRLLELFTAVEAAPVVSEQPVVEPLDAEWVRLAVPPPQGPPGVVMSQLVLAEFGGTSCDSLKFDARFRYAFSGPAFDFTRTLQIQPPLSATTPLKVYLPTYHFQAVRPTPQGVPDADFGFIGLEVPATAADCVTRLGHVSDTSSLPVLFELQLPPQWQRADRFLTIDGWESRTNGDEVPTVYTAPADLEVGRQVLMLPLETLNAGDIAKRSPTLDTSAPVWRNAGVGGVGGTGPYLYLFEMKASPRKTGDLALVQGRIERGGISFGLVKDGQWIEQAGVLERGEFTAVVRAPADGNYSLVLANNLPGSSLVNDLQITRAGWVLPDPRAAKIEGSR